MNNAVFEKTMENVWKQQSQKKGEKAISYQYQVIILQSFSQKIY